MTAAESGEGSRLARLSQLYTDSALGYEEIWAPELLPLSRRLLDELPVSAAGSVLDGAAGVGSLLPDLADRAPEAAVIANDLTPGMLARAPRSFGRVAGDLAHLPFKVDENMPRAFEIWAEELESAGAPPAGETANDELVDTQEKMRSILESAGLQPLKLWSGEYRSTSTPEEFLEHRTKHGQGRWRLAQLDPDSQAGCLARVTRRVDALLPEDFLEHRIVYTVGRKP